MQRTFIVRLRNKIKGEVIANDQQEATKRALDRFPSLARNDGAYSIILKRFVCRATEVGGAVRVGPIADSEGEALDALRAQLRTEHAIAAGRDPLDFFNRVETIHVE